MKKYLILIFSLMTKLLFAQEILVESFEVKPFYNLTGSEIKKDGNGDVCALLKVYFNEKDALFEGAYVISTMPINSYYQVNLAGGATKVVGKHNDYLPLPIVFADYGIKKLESNKAYEITLMSDNTANAFNNTLIDDDIEEKANSGDAESQYKLGKSYYIGINDEQDYKVAFDWFMKSAKQGHIDATYNLGLCYYYGLGVEKNFNEASKYFRIAAYKGHAMAQYKLANCFYYGKKKYENIDEAIMWFERAASQNVLLAKNNVATIYLFNDPTGYFVGTSDINHVGFPEYYSRGLTYLKECADAGITEAYLGLGKAYENGIGVAKDSKTALEYYQKALDAGYVMAYINIGSMYFKGDGVKQNDKKAFEYFTKAAEKGYAEGYYSVALCYQLGKGIKQNFKKAASNYEKAAEQNFALAQNNLGSMFHNGLGVKKDLKKAFDLYNQAAENGDPNGYANIGTMYKNGEYVSQKVSMAIKYFEIAAEKGNYAGLINLANMYQTGNGVSIDADKAIGYYERACKIDKTGAADYNLGVLYYFGCGSMRNDYKKAFEQFEKSARVDYAPAQYNLGCMYLNGEYVAKDENLALSFIKKAAKQKYQPAVDFMNEYNMASIGSLFNYVTITSENSNRNATYYNNTKQQTPMDYHKAGARRPKDRPSAIQKRR